MTAEPVKGEQNPAYRPSGLLRLHQRRQDWRHARFHEFRFISVFRAVANRLVQRLCIGTNQDAPSFIADALQDDVRGFCRVEAIVAEGFAAGLLIITQFGVHGRDIVGGELTYGEFVQFWLLLAMLVRPIRELGERYNVLQSAFASAERLFQILDTAPAVATPPAPSPLPSPAGTPPHVRFEDVRFSYVEDSESLRGVGFESPPGKSVAVVGVTGAGKSTLLHICGLLDRPTKGAVGIGGKDVSKLDDKQRTGMRRSEVGFVYQFHHLLPEFSATENIVLPQLAAGVSPAKAEARAADLLGRVGLGKRAGHRPAALSGGEQQRVAFCRALANEPKLLLADEPTGNLDPATSDQVFDALIELVRGTGLSALIATHNLDLAARMDRRVRLEDGCVVTV